MINRVLIRLKVVQLLYSHYIGDTTFKVEAPAEVQTRERRFAYQLYLDTLAMMVRIADSIMTRDRQYPLAQTKFIIMVRSDEKISSWLRRPSSDNRLLKAEEDITEQLKKSAIYKNYVKEPLQFPRIWEDIMRMFILPNPVYNAAVAAYPDHTLHGVDRMREMMEKTFSNVYSSSDGREAVRNLEHSLAKSRELYFRLLTLPVALVRLEEMDMEKRRQKYNATDEERNPNLRFVENRLVKALSEDAVIERYQENNKVYWLPEDKQEVVSILKVVKESEVYRKYMESDKEGLREDIEFWRTVYRDVLLQSEEFLRIFEDKSVFWNDDFHIIGEFVLKTFRRFGNAATEEEEGRDPVMPMYKDEEDAVFGRTLFLAVVDNYGYYRQMVADIVSGSSWSAERIAFMDMIVIVTALAEILNFPGIPLKVSVNEYVEIAKWYSTEKSGKFVHGILADLVARLKEEGKLQK